MWSAIGNYTNSGTSVAFLMMDLTTGAGVSYNADSYFESASTIKGPYIAALNMYMPWVLESWAGTMYETILNSTNETYAALRQAFEAEPMYRLAKWRPMHGISIGILGTPTTVHVCWQKLWNGDG